MANIQSWAEGYISVIHKSGDAADPNNYRGITITYIYIKVRNNRQNMKRKSSLRLDNLQ